MKTPLIRASPTVLVQMMTYNPRAVAFGLLYAHLDWQDSGQIVMTFQVQVGEMGRGEGEGGRGLQEGISPHKVGFTCEILSRGG